MDENEIKVRGPEYLRGYRAAMEYASAFVREAGEATPFRSAFDVLGDHFAEKIGMVESAAAVEAKLLATIQTVGPPAGYSKLPAGVRCRCPKLWFDGKDHFCCRGSGLTPPTP